MEKKKRSKVKLISIIVFVLMFVAYSYISCRKEYLQILEVGEEYISVYYRNLQYKKELFLFNFIIIFILFFITNIIIKKGLKTFFKDEEKKLPKLPNKSIAFFAATIISSIITIVFFDKFILFKNATWFGTADPIFGLDIGFYFFQKPFIKMIIYYIISLVILLTVYVAVYYIAVFNIYLQGIDKDLLLKSSFLKILKINALIIVIGFASNILLNTYNLVSDSFMTLKDSFSTKIIGAGLTDVTIKLWGYRIFAVVMVLSSIFILNYITKRNKLKKLLVFILLIPAYLLILIVIIILFNLIFVNSNKFDREKEYLGYNINFTNMAYNINLEEEYVKENETTDITKQDLENNKEIINNIRVIDENTTLKTMNSLQTNSSYYTYRTANLQLNEINGNKELVYVLPREIDVSKDISSKNKTYAYTHGFGSIISYANKVSETGNVEYVQKGFENTENTVQIDEPRIYFGMENNNTIITNSNNKTEFDYMYNSNVAVENTYNGKAGIKIGILDRFILSFMNTNVNITFANTNKDSKVILNRNIIDRAKTIMPNLLYDENPYMVISDEGKQVWVLDAYTISNEYPYSQKTSIRNSERRKEFNYIRNSVKVLIDAYDGTVQFYITDNTDPIVTAYSHAYPELFKDSSSIPESISSHFVYSEYLYNIQSNILKIYHNVSEDVLYRANDVWDYASFTNTNKVVSKVDIEPYYTVVKEDNETKIGLVVPYTIYGKQNITAYLIGTVDNNGSLKLKLYKYASGSNVMGTLQLEKQIEQDETISKQIDSINVTGTKLIKNMIIVPINNSLLYVEPIFQQQLNDKNETLLLKKVVVAFGNKVAIGDDLEEALENLVSQSAVEIKIENTDTVNDLINAIISTNSDLKESTASQDFEMIGKDITKLQDLIEQLKKQRDIENKEKVNDINLKIDTEKEIKKDK